MKIKNLNQEKRFCVSVMIDTEDSQLHVVDHGTPPFVKTEFGSLLLKNVRVVVSPFKQAMKASMKVIVNELGNFMDF
ncbi:pyruvate kinase isozyme A, chloroplastic-like [Rutidosis leptorrhynchoides]|uniref:pyruvate kinase isozyme A, chloroplastic-like n=1 Tax=Rutidosis leptorrhynchoides TaxID=125765 RepID=UPI003A9A6272